MALTVAEIMNRELFALRPEEPADKALGYILALGVTGAPVLDDRKHPVGMISTRDLVGVTGARQTVAERMSSPAISVRAHDSIELAGRMLCEMRLHRLVVVDETGAAIGIVSAGDVVAGLLGLPAQHPLTFPHYDPKTGLTWTDPIPLRADRVIEAPDGPGVLLLIHGGVGQPEMVFWAEADTDLRARLDELVNLPQGHLPRLARWLERGDIRFRAASVPDAAQRKRVVDELLEQSRRDLPHTAP